MNIMILVPKVVESYISKFPETQRNAYGYFNYDRRVVNESVVRGGPDINIGSRAPYKGPDELTDADYGVLIRHAKTLINPILAKYSPKVAHEDALHMAIKSFQNGLYDSKINAGRYNVLLAAMLGTKAPTTGTPIQASDVEATKKKEKKEKNIKQTLKPFILKQLGITRKDVARPTPKGKQPKNTIVKEKGQIVLKTEE